jgi:hypothetical protein
MSEFEISIACANTSTNLKLATTSTASIYTRCAVLVLVSGSTDGLWIVFADHSPLVITGPWIQRIFGAKTWRFKRFII